MGVYLVMLATQHCEQDVLEVPAKPESSPKIPHVGKCIKYLPYETRDIARKVDFGLGRSEENRESEK